jgi:beta-glucosidase/6-phospho-beta-glucosidase/beta-galactosidase
VPFGAPGSPLNTQALDHYEDVIATCLAYGVTPIVKLSHFDYPTTVDMIGNSTLFADSFMYYAKAVATRYADRVPLWFTFNEPNAGIGVFFDIFTSYNSMATILLAHATFYRWYKDTLQGTGRVSLKVTNNLAVPLHGPDNTSDVAAALRYQDFVLGIMANPLFLGTQYPDSVLTTPCVNLTPLTDAQLALINGTADLWAFDPYVAQFASAPPPVKAASPRAPQPAPRAPTTRSGRCAPRWAAPKPMAGPSAPRPTRTPSSRRSTCASSSATCGTRSALRGEFWSPSLGSPSSPRRSRPIRPGCARTWAARCTTRVSGPRCCGRCGRTG